jgi:hypothetical protein
MTPPVIATVLVQLRGTRDAELVPDATNPSWPFQTS